MLFKKLSKKQEREYRKWIRSYYQPLTNILGVWHPAAQDECVRMNREACGLSEDATSDPA